MRSHIENYERALSDIEEAIVLIRRDDDNLRKRVKKSARRIRKQLQVVRAASKICRVEALDHVKGDD